MTDHYKSVGRAKRSFKLKGEEKKKTAKVYPQLKSEISLVKQMLVYVALLCLNIALKLFF